jgi:chitin disaccharide deacetylase
VHGRDCSEAVLQNCGVRIVLNADDFGLSTDTVGATIEAFELGRLTSASLMAGMPATDEAVAFARSHPEFSFGVHLTFVGDGVERAAAPSSDVPALVEDADGRFPATNVVRLRAMLRRLPQAQIEREMEAQISAIREGGVPVSHVDSHRHLHKYAVFRRALERVARRAGIERVRTVQDVYLRRPLTSPTYLLGRAWRRQITRAFTTTDHFYMPTSSRDVRWTGLEARLGRLPRGHTLEIGLHPGREEAWRRAEYEALAEFVETARPRHSLVTWREIGSRQ